MEFEKLKAAAETITMPDEMKRRIVGNCKTQISNSRKEIVMKTNKNTVFRKPAVGFAAVVICLSLAVAAVASPGTRKGFFRDIKDWRGAVVGTSYEQASDEIGMEVAINGEELTVLATFVDPQMAPYRYVKWLGIADYRIVNANGKTVKEGAEESVEAINGCGAIPINLENLESGTYKLIVTAFVSDKKGDQPLEIHGHWECVFVK